MALTLEDAIAAHTSGVPPEELAAIAAFLRELDPGNPHPLPEPASVAALLAALPVRVLRAPEPDRSAP